MLLLKAPGEEAVGVSCVAVEKATMIMGQASQLPFTDKLACILDERSPAIVVADGGYHPGFTGGSSTPDGFLWIFANWFLAEDVFASLRCCPVDFQMHPIWGSHANGFDLGVGNDGTPVGGIALEAKALLGGSRTCFYGIGADNEPRLNATFIKTVWNGAIRATMHFAHPTHANHPDTDSTCHDDTSNVVHNH